jgi:hypothetical protein
MWICFTILGQEEEEKYKKLISFKPNLRPTGQLTYKSANNSINQLKENKEEEKRKRKRRLVEYNLV